MADRRTSETPVDSEPEEPDLLGQRLLHGDTRWTLDLDNPYFWVDSELSNRRHIGMQPWRG